MLSSNFLSETLIILILSFLLIPSIALSITYFNFVQNSVIFQPLFHDISGPFMTLGLQSDCRQCFVSGGEYVLVEIRTRERATMEYLFLYTEVKHFP